jgi:hypothetical protein
MLKRFRRGASGGNFIFPDHGAALTPWSSRSIRVWQGALVFLKPNPIAHVDIDLVAGFGLGGARTAIERLYTARSLSGLISKCGVLKLGAPLSIEQLQGRRP